MGNSTNGCESLPLWGCVKVSLELGLSIIGFLSCVTTLAYAVISARKNATPVRKWGVTLLVLGLLECTLLVVHYASIDDVVVLLVGTYFKYLQFDYLSYVFAKHACNIFKKKELVRRLLFPVFGLLTLFMTVFTVVVCITSIVIRNQESCADDHWVVTSSINFALAVIFLLIGMFILKQLSRVRMSAPARSRKKRQLVALLVIYFLSSLVGFVYDIASLLYARNGGVCDQFFGAKNPAANAFFVVLIRFLDLLLPIFGVVLFEFMSVRRPIRKLASHHGFHIGNLNSFVAGTSASPASSALDTSAMSNQASLYMTKPLLGGSYASTGSGGPVL